jgi:hypothetical protein
MALISRPGYPLRSGTRGIVSGFARAVRTSPIKSILALAASRALAAALMMAIAGAQAADDPR